MLNTRLSETNTHHLYDRRPTFTRFSYWIPKSSRVSTLSEDGDAGEKIDDQRLCNHNVYKDSTCFGGAENANHENHEGDSTKCGGHDGLIRLALFEMQLLDLSRKHTKWLRHKQIL